MSKRLNNILITPDAPYQKDTLWIEGRQDESVKFTMRVWNGADWIPVSGTGSGSGVDDGGAYISKVRDDYANGHISFKNGISIGDVRITVKEIIQKIRNEEIEDPENPLYWTEIPHKFLMIDGAVFATKDITAGGPPSFDENTEEKIYITKKTFWETLGTNETEKKLPWTLLMYDTESFEVIDNVLKLKKLPTDEEGNVDLDELDKRYILKAGDTATGLITFNAGIDVKKGITVTDKISLSNEDGKTVVFTVDSEGNLHVDKTIITDGDVIAGGEDVEDSTEIVYLTAGDMWRLLRGSSGSINPMLLPLDPNGSIFIDNGYLVSSGGNGTGGGGLTVQQVISTIWSQLKSDSDDEINPSHIKKFIRKDIDDEAAGTITFKKGIKFVSGDVEVEVDVDPNTGLLHVKGGMYADGDVTAGGPPSEEASDGLNLSEVASYIWRNYIADSSGKISGSSLHIDPNTLGVSNGMLYVKGSTGGGSSDGSGLSIVDVISLLTSNEESFLIDNSHINKDTLLTDYALQESLNTLQETLEGSIQDVVDSLEDYVLKDDLFDGDYIQSTLIGDEFIRIDSKNPYKSGVYVATFSSENTIGAEYLLTFEFSDYGDSDYRIATETAVKDYCSDFITWNDVTGELSTIGGLAQDAYDYAEEIDGYLTGALQDITELQDAVETIEDNIEDIKNDYLSKVDANTQTVVGEVIFQDNVAVGKVLTVGNIVLKQVGEYLYITSDVVAQGDVIAEGDL